MKKRFGQGFRFVFWIALGLVLGVVPTGGAEPGSFRSVDVEELLRSMTLEEKIGQMTLFTSDWDKTGPSVNPKYLDYIRQGKCGAIFNAYGAEPTRKLQEMAVGETRLKIPLLFGYDVIHGHRTIFPIPLAEACSWDLPAMERSARIAAREASAEGLHWTFAPMVDIARDPRWGRVSEGAGEDVWLGCRIAQARVRGFQGNDLRDPESILACAKHFAAYGAPEAGRDYNVVDLSERALEELYLPPYRACVEAGVKTFMTSFNEIAGIPCTSNRKLLTSLLKERWGFPGFIVTDYTAINELIPHGVAADLREASQLAANAGVDMDMQGAGFLDHLSGLVKTGLVPMERIDDAVRRILLLKRDLGLFEDPFRSCDEARQRRVVLCREHLQAAYEAACQSMVLLKNDRNTLPFSNKLRRVAVIGPLAKAQLDLLGNWHGAGDGNKVVSILDALREKLGNQVEVTFAEGCGVTETGRGGFRRALETARRAEAILLILGEKETMSGEAASRADIDLPGVQNELAEKLARLGKPLAVVLVNGRPLALGRVHQAVPAILEAWFPGTMGGKAVADTIFGDSTPSGKLVMTFPRNVGQIPIHYDSKNTGRPMAADNKYTSKYLDVPNTPLYPFGHGLSYTSFAYSSLAVSRKEISPVETMTAEVQVENTGSRPGTEIVQWYIRDHVAQVTRPLRQLRGFQRVLLQPREKKTVQCKFGPSDLGYLKPDSTFGTDPGTFSVFVGGSSDTTLAAEFQVR